MIVVAYFFTDEAEQLQGPFRTEADAGIMEHLYVKSQLNKENLTESEQSVAFAINLRAQDLRAGINMAM
jgi:hypothetical protein